MGSKRTLWLMVVLVLIGASSPLPSVAQTSVPPAVLVGAGDIAVCGADYDERTAHLLDDIEGTVFTLGDNVYPNGTAAEFAASYEPSWGRHKHRTRPAPGNHDYHTEGATGYFAYFGAAAGDPDKGYYSYTLGAWQVVVLNSNIAADANSPQAKWLRDELTAKPATCTLAMWHHPRFSSGRHGNDERFTDLWRILYAHRAEVVLNGHDHLYERFAPQTPDGKADSERGLRQFTVGTGGAMVYAFMTIRPNSEKRMTNTWGVLKLTLAPTSYEWEFIPIEPDAGADRGEGWCVA